MGGLKILDSWGPHPTLGAASASVACVYCASYFVLHASGPSTRLSQAAPALNPRAVPRASRAAPSRATQATAAASLSVRAARRQQSRRSASRSSSSTAADSPPALYGDALTLRRKTGGDTFSGCTVCRTTRLAQRGEAAHILTHNNHSSGACASSQEILQPDCQPSTRALAWQILQTESSLHAVAGAFGAPPGEREA